MDTINWTLIIILVLFFAIAFYTLYLLLSKKRNTQPNNQLENKDNDNSSTYEKCKFSRKRLLTKHELDFYKTLREISDKNGYHILSKVRVADILKISEYPNPSIKQGVKNKITRKHVDFALVNPDNFYIVLLVELDDKSHDSEKGIARDKFIDYVYKDAGIPIIHVRNNQDLEQKILSTALPLYSKTTVKN